METTAAQTSRRDEALRLMYKAHARAQQAMADYGSNPGDHSYCAATHWVVRNHLEAFRARWSPRAQEVVIVGPVGDRKVLFVEVDGTAHVVSREVDLLAEGQATTATVTPIGPR